MITSPNPQPRRGEATEHSDYLAVVVDRLEEWKREAKTLRARADGATQRLSEPAATAVRSALDVLTDREREVEARVALLRFAKGEAWDTTKADVELAWKELATASQNAVCELESDIHSARG